MNLKLITFFTLVLVSYTIEKLQVQCKNKDNLIKREILSILHHILAIWLYFGSFIFNTHYRLHLLALLTIVALWDVTESFTGIHGCSVSRIYNTLCGVRYDLGFQDLVGLLGFVKIAMLTVMYDLYFISKGNI